MTIGIIGCGFIGGALKKWLEEHNPNIAIRVRDPAKGFDDDMSDIDVAFVSIHIPTQPDGTQDLSVLEQIIGSLPEKPIFIRTTVLPGTCDYLSDKTGRRVYFMPEFLTQRTAYSDFCVQPMIFSAEEDLLAQIFVGKKYILMSSFEAELVKYVHNVFGALKVTYFNCVYDICRRKGLNFEKVRDGVLLSGYINDVHTMVPGPDGRLGYGGKCFPKDVDAFTKYCSDFPMAALLEQLRPLNELFRNHDAKAQNEV